MFLHALLFFLLAIPVFTAERPNTQVAKPGGGYPKYYRVVQAEKRHVGFWYPIKAVGVQIVSRISLIFGQVSHPCHSDPEQVFRFSPADKLNSAG